MNSVLKTGELVKEFKRSSQESNMGLTTVDAKLTAPNSKQVSVSFTVDSGVTYTLVPYQDWQALGLTPKKTMTFTLADGTTIQRQISECHISLFQGEGHTPVTLGEPVMKPY